MVDSKDDEYKVQCAAFLTIIDSDVPAEAFVATIRATESEQLSEEFSQPAPDDTCLPEPANPSHSWADLAVYSAELEQTQLPEEGIYEPPRIWERPPGHTARGIDAFKVLCHVNSLNEPVVAVVGDSGAAPTLISHKFLQMLQASKPKSRTGSKLRLIQLTGEAGCSEYVKLDLYFRSQLGPVRLKGVEAYMVKGMEANLIVGEDTQMAWQMHTIRPGGKRHWKVGDSPHCIPSIPGLAPKEAFTVKWATEPALTKTKTLATKKPIETKCSQWNVVAKEQVVIMPESIATITAVSRGAPNSESMYLEGIGLKRGSDSFVQVPDGLVNLDSEGCFQVKIVNTTKRRIIVRSGELVGRIYRVNKALKATTDMSKQELDEFSS